MPGNSIIRVPAAALRPVIAHAASAIYRKSSVPVLLTARLRADKKAQRLAVTTTDLDNQLTVSCEADVAQPAEFLVPGYMAERILRLASGEVTITVNGQEHTLGLTDVDGLDVELRNLIPIEDFPSMRDDAFEEARRLTLGEDELARGLRAVSFCISAEETRYYLNGIYMTTRPSDPGLRMVATDGHRLAIRDFSTDWPAPPIILPTRAVAILARLLRIGGNRSIAVAVAPDGLRVRFSCGDFDLISKTIDGTFPDYTRVLPAPSSAISVTMTRAAAARLAGLTAGSMTRAVMLDAAKGEASLRVPDLNMTAKVPMSGTGAPFGLNVHYLRRFFLDDDVVRISGAGPDGPMRIEGADAMTTWVCMPIRV